MHNTYVHIISEGYKICEYYIYLQLRALASLPVGYELRILISS